MYRYSTPPTYYDYPTPPRASHPSSKQPSSMYNSYDYVSTYNPTYNLPFKSSEGRSHRRRASPKPFSVDASPYTSSDLRPYRHGYPYPQYQSSAYPTSEDGYRPSSRSRSLKKSSILEPKSHGPTSCTVPAYPRVEPKMESDLCSPKSRGSYKTTSECRPAKSIETTSSIPAGYSAKNWDPSEESIFLLGSVFDANSPGKWIYDLIALITVPYVSTKELACQLRESIPGSRHIGRCIDASTVRHRHNSSSCSCSRYSNRLMVLLERLIQRTIRSKIPSVLSWCFLTRLASALPVGSSDDAGGNSGGPGRPGLPSLSGWPSPVLGLVFAASVTGFAKSRGASRLPSAMAFVFNYVSLVVSADATTPPAVLWTYAFALFVEVSSILTCSSLRGLATYFVVLYADDAFRKYQMGQG